MSPGYIIGFLCTFAFGVYLGYKLMGGGEEK